MTEDVNSALSPPMMLSTIPGNRWRIHAYGTAGRPMCRVLAFDKLLAEGAGQKLVVGQADAPENGFNGWDAGNWTKIPAEWP